MLPRARFRLAVLTLAAMALYTMSGCTGPVEYLRNGLKVGPNYQRPQACTQPHWIDATDARIRQEPASLAQWWTVFHDPALDGLIACACRQNLSLREAGFRILEARAELGIAQGNFFPQGENRNGGLPEIRQQRRQPPNLHDHRGRGRRIYSPGWNAATGHVLRNWPADVGSTRDDGGREPGLNLAWEVDFWGRFRRSIVAAEDTLEANCADYNGVMVTLLGDVARYYVQLRTDQKRIELARANVGLQRRVLEIARRRFQEGQTNDLDLNQARSTLAQTESQIPLLLSDLRAGGDPFVRVDGHATGNPARRSSAPAPIPTAPTTVVVGIPADLLRRRPDVCRAERLAAAQAEQIGIAEVDLYPDFQDQRRHGLLGGKLSQLFESNAFYGSVGPGVQWNILNYGRIRNNMRLQDAKFHGAGHDLPANGAPGGGRGGERDVALLARAGSLEAPRREREQFATGGQHGRQTVRGRRHRLHAGLAGRAGPRRATRRASRFAWPGGPGID